MNYEQNNWPKVILIGAYVLLITGVIVAWNTPCVGYEANIYAETPLLFWIGLFVSYAVGIGITLLSTFYHRLPTHITYFGYFLIILSSVALMFLTVIRGYMMLNISGDGGSHLGKLKEIIETGIGPYTYYPGTYYEPAAFQLLTGLDSETVLSIFPMLMLCLFTLGVWILARRVLPETGEKYFSLITALILPVGSTLMIGTSVILYGGMTISNMGLLPLFIFLILIIIAGEKNFLLPTLILSISILFYHPYVTVICFVIYGCAILFSLMPLFGRKKVEKKSIQQLFTLFVIMFGSFFTWYWSFFGNTIISGIKLIFESTSIEERGIGSTVSAFQNSGDIGYIITTGLEIAGINIFIYGMLVVAGIIFLLKYWGNERYFFLKVLYAFAVVVGGMMVVAAVGDFGGGYLRFKQTIYIAALLSTGFVMYRIFLFITKSRAKVTFPRMLVIFLILIFVSGMSVTSFHPSPNTYNGGYQTTQTTYTGVETLLPLIDYDKNSTGIHLTSTQRYVNAIYGSASTVGSNAYGDTVIISTSRSSTDYADALPYHFGYDTGIASLNEIYGDGELFFIIEKDWEFYPAYHPERMDDYWSRWDFEHLNMDKGVGMAYNNGGLQLYTVI